LFIIIHAQHIQPEFVFIPFIDEELRHLCLSLFLDVDVAPQLLDGLLTGFLIFDVLFGDLGTASH
jgi:hypothetical protein